MRNPALFLAFTQKQRGTLYLKFRHFVGYLSIGYGSFLLATRGILFVPFLFQCVLYPFLDNITTLRVGLSDGFFLIGSVPHHSKIAVLLQLPYFWEIIQSCVRHFCAARLWRFIDYL